MATISPDLIDWRERQYVSQYSMPPLQLQIYVAGVPGDPDGQSVTASMLLQNGDGTTSPVNSYAATRIGTGNYQVVPSSSDTSVPADAELIWAYSISSAPQQYATYIVIGPANPAFDTLPPDMQDLVELVWVRFADLCDSPAGGPNITATPYFQAHWSRGRVSQLMTIALQKINGVSQPWSNYSTGAPGSQGPPFPVRLWGGLLNQYTYVEAVKHLIRSYTEQPDLAGGSVTRLTRRDYTDRWREVLRDEEAELKSLLDMFKIRHMGLGNPRVLVSGGTYGRYAPTRIAGSVAARPRMWARKPMVLIITGVLCPHAIVPRSLLLSERAALSVSSRPFRSLLRPLWRPEGMPSVDRLNRQQHWLRPAQLERAWRQAPRACSCLGIRTSARGPQGSCDRQEARRRSHMSQCGHQLPRRQAVLAPAMRQFQPS